MSIPIKTCKINEKIVTRKVLYKTLQRGTNKFNKELAKGAEKFIKQTATSIGI